MRSMTSTYWTKINFTILELLHMIARVEIQNDIAYFKMGNDLVFPRIRKDHAIEQPTHELPSNHEIANTIKRALNDAVDCASKFGMTIETTDAIKCTMRKAKTFRKPNPGGKIDEEESCQDSSEDEHPILDSNTDRNESLNLRDYSTSDIELGENSKYIQIYESDGSSKIVLKSSVVWLLSESVPKLSSDRLKRVQSTPLQKIQKRQKTRNPSKLHSHVTSSDECSSRILHKSNEIHLGEWCVFSCDLNTRILEGDVIKNIVFGSVLAFRHTEGKTDKEKQYHKDYANIYDETQENKRQDLEVLSAWYMLNGNGELVSMGIKSNFYLNIKNYISSSLPPKIIRDQVLFVGAGISREILCLEKQTKESI